MSTAWLHTLKARSFLTFLFALLVGQSLLMVAFSQWVMAPRAREWGETLALQVKQTQAALQSLPLAQRPSVAQRLGVLQDEVSVLSAQEPARTVEATRAPIPVRALARGLQASLGNGHRVSYDTADAALLVSFEVDDLKLIKRMGLREPTEYLRRSTLVLAVAAGSISLLLAALVQWRLARPLQRLRLAAAQPPGEPLQKWRRHNDPAEIAEVLDELEHRGAELARLNGERLMLLAGVSHDVRTPLAKLRLELEMAHELTPQRQKDMKRYLGQADTTLQQFLAVVRGELVEAVQEVDLAGLCGEAVKGLDGRAQESHTATWRVHMPAALQVWVRPVMMRRLVDNLLDNACTYGHPPLELRLHRDAQRITLQVIDHGPGIAPSQHEQAIAPFVQLNRELDIGGSGLGLAIARQIALMHGGGLRLATPAEGQGLMVEVWLPVLAGKAVSAKS